MGPGGYEDFMGRRSGFFSNVKNMWPQTRRLNELWIRGQDEYLYQEAEKLPLPEGMRELLPDKVRLPHPKVRAHMVLHWANLAFAEPRNVRPAFQEYTAFLSPHFETLLRSNRDGLTQLAAYFVDQGLLAQYEEKYLERLQQLVDTFQFFVPIFGLRFYQAIPQNWPNQVRHKRVN